MAQPFVLGVNYWPRKKAMYWWSNFEADEVRSEFGIIKSIDPERPVTYGLHGGSFSRNDSLRLDNIYAETNVAVMHTYPMYVSWSRDPLDADVVPFSCALTTALCGKPTLMEEFGGPTTPPGEDSYVMEWVSYGQPRTQFMASEADFARYIEEVLPKLVDVGATGALLWCFSDYVPELWDKPPCEEAVHERFFGLIRPDGSLKPHAEVIRQFAATQPQVKEVPVHTVELDVSNDEYFEAPSEHLVRLYHRYLEQL